METKCYCGHTAYCDCGPETLEEAFEKNAQCLDAFENKNTYEYGFKDGANWQQEQIGKSEFLQKLRGTLSDAEARRLIFEQFKNDRL